MRRLWFIIVPFIFAACSLIDDDLTVCGEDVLLDYQLQLHTELSMQLQTELMTETEEPVRNALSKWLAPIFTETAKDVDLRFFSTESDDIRYWIQEVINRRQRRYTIQLPKENYMHLGIANLADNNHLQLVDGEHSATMALRLPEDVEEVSSLNTGVFSARMPMVIGDSSQTFEVRLYMTTCAVALVIDTTFCDSLVSIEGKMIGSAVGFMVNDSSYIYNKDFRIVMDSVAVERIIPQYIGRRAPGDPARDTYMCLAASSFPTQDNQAWQMEVKTTLTGNRHTTTRLEITDPLKAGALRIVRLHVDGQGGVQPVQGTEVGVSVTLDWKDGGTHDIDL